MANNDKNKQVSDENPDAVTHKVRRIGTRELKVRGSYQQCEKAKQQLEKEGWMDMEIVLIDA